MMRARTETVVKERSGQSYDKGKVIRQKSLD